MPHMQHSLSPTNYYGNVNPDLLGLVDPAARRICEFGCGAGALARAMRERCPGVHVVGVELMADQLARAADVLDVALVRDLNLISDWSADRELAAALPVHSFDHVVFGDVLEHLYDPEAAVRQAAERLAPGGSVLACIPNVQHWSVFAQLIRGSWPRRDGGLFDRTHIRWFMLSDMLLLMRDQGLSVVRIVPRVTAHERREAVIESLKPLADLMGVDHADFRRRSVPLQYVLEARKPV